MSSVRSLRLALVLMTAVLAFGGTFRCSSDDDDDDDAVIVFQAAPR